MMVSPESPEFASKLAAEYADSQFDRESLWSQICHYLNTFDTQAARKNPDPLIRLLKSIPVDSTTVIICNLLADSPYFIIAISRFAPSKHHLTPIHVLFLSNCLAARAYSAARPLLDIPLYEFSAEYTTYHHHLLFHFYAGTILLALRMLPQARRFFAIVVAAPGSACSQIQLEAYKKWLLISVILGLSAESPKNASLALQRAVSSCIPSSYGELVTAVQSDCHTRILNVIDKGGDIWRQDGNIGLVNLCFNTIPKRIVKKIKETYLTISLEELSRLLLLSPQDSKSLVEQMVRSNELVAVISPTEPIIVTFPNTLPTISSFNSLEISKTLFQLKQQLGASKEVLSKAGLGQGNSSPKGSYMNELAAEENIMDEDFRDDFMDFE